MTDAIALHIDRWTMSPWLPLGGVLLALFAFALLASYSWVSRPSGQASERRGILARNAPLMVLIFPILIFAGFAQILVPVAAPETLVLRSRAVGLGATAIPIPCFERTVEALVAGRPEAPTCLAAMLPTGEVALRDLADAVVTTEATFDTLWEDDTDLLLGTPDYEDTIERAMPDPVRTDPVQRERVMGFIRHGRKWWAWTRGTRPMDAAPVVDRAVELFEAARFTDRDYTQADPALTSALERAARQALRETAPREIEEGGTADCRIDATMPGCRPAKVGVPPAAVEALEVAVLRMLAAQRNVQGILAETHPRIEGPVERDRWTRLRLSLLTGDQTGSGKPVGVVSAIGSAQSAGEALRITGRPWLRPAPAGYAGVSHIVYVQLQIGALLTSDIIFSVLDDENKELNASCTPAGSPIRTFDDCFAGQPLQAGDSVLLRLALRETFLSDPEDLTFRIAFEDAALNDILDPIVTDTAMETVMVRAYGDAALSDTLQCLIAPDAAALSASPALTAFTRHLSVGNVAQLVEGADGATITLIDDETDAFRGLWVHPSAMPFSVVRGLSLDRGRPAPLDPLIATTGELYGAALFPVAVTSTLPTARTMPLWYTPLRPEREPSALPGASDNPARGLRLPRSVRIRERYAEPVAYSVLASDRQKTPLHVHNVTAAPLVWRIEMPADRAGGGVVWYYDIDPAEQGLLLRDTCIPIPERPEAADFCSLADPMAERVYNPVYDEARFMPFWLSILRAARETGIDAGKAPLPEPELHAPDFLEPWIVAQARMGSAFPGLLCIALGLFGYAVFVVVLRLRQHLGGFV